MAYTDPSRLPADRLHLDEEERDQLLRFELLVAQGRIDEAQEIVEDLWIVATDAHKALYQGLSNALTAVVARNAQKIRGASEIVRESRSMLASFPRRVLDMDLDALLDSVQVFVVRGDGPILLLRQD